MAVFRDERGVSPKLAMGACQIAGSVALPVVTRRTCVTTLAIVDVTELVGIVFSGLSALVIEDVEDAGEVIVVRARTRGDAVACPGCGTGTSRVHAITSGRRPTSPSTGGASW